MKFFVRFILILVVGYFALKFFPFWVSAFVAFVVGLGLSEQRKRRMFGKKTPPPLSFLAGFLAMFLLWGGFTFLIDHQNASLLSQKVAQLIPGAAGSAGNYMMIIISALIGGLLGGFGALSGNLLGEAIKS